ncbi:hypothetical protein GCM10010269_57640 [Streptomyces humidus]|uniref:Uncharacterized protein n=1 Tax=Streptomyces humidus TaxID=52259 RepID=A0A918G0N0_9ACTN|nr:hypothetical protein GCM10010269_57640 [Streptomyces humidus]
MAREFTPFDRRSSRAQAQSADGPRKGLRGACRTSRPRAASTSRAARERGSRGDAGRGGHGERPEARHGMRGRADDPETGAYDGYRTVRTSHGGTRSGTRSDERRIG